MKRKILVITDVGRDVDDVLALSVLQSLHSKGDIEVVGIVTTHMIPEVRGRIARLISLKFGTKIPVGAGSPFPIGQEGEQELLHAYLEEHRISGHDYEGVGLESFNPRSFALFRDAKEVILNAVIDNPDELYILVLAPMTDLAKAVLHNLNVFLTGGIRGIFVQGNASLRDDGELVPDPIAYNISEDLWAARIVMEQLGPYIPFTFLGKWAAYSAPLTREDFLAFADTRHPVGRYLYETAVNGLRCFAQRMPDLYRRLYTAGEAFDPDDPIANATHLSNPYDPATAIALACPSIFDPIRMEHHTFIGMDRENPCVRNPGKLKELIIGFVLDSLAKREQSDKTAEG